MGIYGWDNGVDYEKKGDRSYKDNNRIYTFLLYVIVIVDAYLLLNFDFYSSRVETTQDSIRVWEKEKDKSNIFKSNFSIFPFFNFDFLFSVFFHSSILFSFLILYFFFSSKSRTTSINLFLINITKQCYIEREWYWIEIYKGNR